MFVYLFHKVSEIKVVVEIWFGPYFLEGLLSCKLSLVNTLSQSNYLVGRHVIKLAVNRFYELTKLYGWMNYRQIHIVLISGCY